MEIKEIVEEEHGCKCSSGGFITEKDARKMISRYKKSPTFYLNSKVKAHFFGSDMIKKLLSMDDAIGIRLYYGYKKCEDETLSPQLLMVSVNSQGNDMYDEGVGDESLPCPRFCPKEGLDS